MNRRCLLCGAVFVGTVLLSVIAKGSIVINGSFETPYVEHDWVNFSAGQTFGGWTVGRGSVDLVSDVGTREYWPAAQGRQSVDLNGWEPGSIWQELTTVPGATYAFRFALSGNPVGSPIRVSMAFSWEDTVIETLSFITSAVAGDMGWTYYEYVLPAQGDKARLTFESVDTTWVRGPALDDVSVTPVTVVPEPSTVWAGLGAVLALALRGAQMASRRVCGALRGTCATRS